MEVSVAKKELARARSPTALAPPRAPPASHPPLPPGAQEEAEDEAKKAAAAKELADKQGQLSTLLAQFEASSSAPHTPSHNSFLRAAANARGTPRPWRPAADHGAAAGQGGHRQASL